MSLKVTAVSYLNTKPFLYGLFKSGLNEEIDLQLDIPSDGARRLASGEADLGLVPVAVIPELATPHIISDYCIGTVGTVKTVCIFSECPLEEMTHLYLDHHSRTSVELVQLLLKDHWRQSTKLLQATEGFEAKIGGTTGALIIGDRAIGKDLAYPFVYDLGEAWQQFTGLPFVFAAWVSNRPLDPAFVQRFNAALQMGLDHIPQLMYILPSPQPGFDLQRYFTENISYQLDRDKKRALKLFLQMMGKVHQREYAAVGLEG
ncbi:MAG: menaquinone biosynthesis protein [Saprospiraceae bacterium]